MRVIKWMFITMVVLIAAVIGAGFLLPDQVHVERSIVTTAKPGTVYAALNGFRYFNSWSPWADLDPNAIYTIEGPPVGVGAKAGWSSEDPNVGTGSQEIVEVRDNEYVRIRLVFSGFDSENYSTYTLTPEGEGTRITWGYDTTFHGNLMGRYFGLMLDAMIGADYEKGLAKLKVLVEGLPAVTGAVKVEVVTVAARPLLYVSGETSVDQVSAALDQAYGAIEAFMEANALKPVEAPLAITRHFDERNKIWRFEAALVPDRADRVPPADGAVKAGTSYAGLALRAVHAGPHASMDDTYEQVIAYKVAAGLEDGGVSWEQYQSDPASVAPADLKTDIYWAVR